MPNLRANLPMPNCLDLKSLYGDRYRVETDESYYAETGSTTNCNRDPWL
mgnify:CR=1 FL=1